MHGAGRVSSFVFLLGCGRAYFEQPKRSSHVKLAEPEAGLRTQTEDSCRYGTIISAKIRRKLYEPPKIIYLKTRHTFKSCNIYLKPEL